MFTIRPEESQPFHRWNIDAYRRIPTRIYTRNSARRAFFLQNRFPARLIAGCCPPPTPQANAISGNRAHPAPASGVKLHCSDRHTSCGCCPADRDCYYFSRSETAGVIVRYGPSAAAADSALGTANCGMSHDEITRLLRGMNQGSQTTRCTIFTRHGQPALETKSDGCGNAVNEFPNTTSAMDFSACILIDHKKMSVM